MTRGIGLVSGSSTVLFQVTDDASFIVGRDAPVTMQMSGSLNLRVGGQAANRWLRATDASGNAIWSQMSASLVASVPLGNLTSSDVGNALNELQNHINAVSNNGSLTFTDGVNQSVVFTTGSLVTITGSTSQLVSTFNVGTKAYTLSFAPNIFITGSTITVGPFTASNGITVTGLSSLQTVGASTISASANVYAQNLTITGSTTLGTSGSQANQTTLNGLFQVPIFTAGNVPSVYVNDPFKYVGYMFYLQGAGSGTFTQGGKWYYNEAGTWFPSMFFSGS